MSYEKLAIIFDINTMKFFEIQNLLQKFNLYKTSAKKLHIVIAEA